jgi:predicted DNA-binding transcriptional regulator AlpA
MGRLVDVDDLIDSAEVARICGLSNRNSVRTYRRRYPDFPAPVVDLGEGRCLLFLRSEIEPWNRNRPRRQRRAPDAG